MNSVKSSTAGINYLDEIPFRGRWLDSNWIGYCTGCKTKRNIWYGSASRENRKKMEVNYRGQKNCPDCVVRKRGHNTLDIYKRMPVEEAMKILWLQRNDTGIDFGLAEESARSQARQDIQATENEIKSDWYLQRAKS